MRPAKRSVWSWTFSVLVHILLFFLVFPGGGQSAGNGGLFEIGLVEMPGEVTKELASLITPAQATPEEPPAPQPEPEPEPVDTLEGENILPAPEEIKPEEAPAPSTPAAAAPAHGQTATPAGEENTAGQGTGSGAGRGPGYGSGASFVLSGPIQYPKSAQNEGVEGRVRLAVYLKPGAKAKAEILEGSGDKRLDSYSLRAVTEAWKYTRAPEPLRILVTLSFEDGKVNVDFEGSEPWNEEESRS